MTDLSKFKLLYQPHIALESQVEPFTNKDVEYRNGIANHMAAIMEKYRGVGLAANQINFPYAIFVMQAEGSRMDIFNPSIINVSDKKILMTEGCLSDPGLYLNIQRPDAITVRYEDANGTEYEEDLYNASARIFLHEYDHLMGISFTDRVGKTKLNMAYKKRDKLLKSLKK